MKFKYLLRLFSGICLLASILILFRIPISRLLNTIIVKPLLLEFEVSFLSDFITIILGVTIAVWLAKTVKTDFLLRAGLCCLVFYGLQKFNDFWCFTKTMYIPHITYWDIPAAALSISMILNFYYKRAPISLVKQDQGFIEDHAIISLEEDHFKREQLASAVAQQIKLTKNKKSFGIGILGQYGSGKTSFLNLINLNLMGDEFLQVAFNPWGAGNPDMIRKEFFDLLAQKVAEVDYKISSLIYDYGRRLANVDSKALSWVNWLGLFGNGSFSQTAAEYSQINNLLGSINRKIIVTIDDLDRLYPPEIIEVLKLIRNTADFSNVFYLVGYDKTFINDALKMFGGASQHSYLDKIFQLEIPLPKREENDLMLVLKTYLIKFVSDEHFSYFENTIIPNGFRSRYEKSYDEIFRQNRDVIRFINSFKIVYDLIGDEVDFECLFVLELIKFRFPTIYDLIYVSRDIFLFDMPVRSTHEQYFSPRMIKAESGKNTIDEISAFKRHLDEMKEFSADEVALLDRLFLVLFKGSRYIRPEVKNSISYPLYFEIYFRFRLSQTDLSDKDFKAALKTGKMQKYMIYCASHGLHKELMLRLMQENVLIDQNYFEKIIHYIFLFGRTFVELEGAFKFDYDALINKLYNYHNSISDKLYRKNTSQYKTFIKSLFEGAIAPYLFENEVLYHFKLKDDQSVLLTKEINELQLSYFTQMANSGHALSKETLLLFWGAREYYNLTADGTGGYTRHWHFEQTLANEMKKYLAFEDPTEFLKFSVERNIRNHSEHYITKQVLEMFATPQEFRELVRSNNLLKEDVKIEYLDLFDKLAKNNFILPVDLELKTELKKLD